MHFWFWAQMDPLNGPTRKRSDVDFGQWFGVMFFWNFVFTVTLFHPSHVLNWNCLVLWRPYQVIAFIGMIAFQKIHHVPHTLICPNILHPPSYCWRVLPFQREGNAWTIRFGGCWSCWWTCSFDGQCHWAEIMAMKGWAPHRASTSNLESRTDSIFAP